MRKWLLCLCLLTQTAFASSKVLNIFVWGNEIPDSVVHQFERDTGIKVNLSSYESNEALYAKIKLSPKAYDIIEPSGYYVSRLAKEHLIESLQRDRLPALTQLLPLFAHPAYDPKGQFSVPLIWGATGIFVNPRYFDPKKIQSWRDLAQPRYKNQLLLLDDPREVFSMALLANGQSPNTNKPAIIAKAYAYLLKLLPNIKLYASDAVATIIADEDARIGMAWSGDIARAREANPKIQFIFPKEGFVVWSDNLAIMKNAPHKDNAYLFLAYCLRKETAKQIALETGYPITQQAGIALLPESIRNNPLLYPSEATLKNGIVQTDLSDAAKSRYEFYWERLKTR